MLHRSSALAELLATAKKREIWNVAHQEFLQDDFIEISQHNLIAYLYVVISVLYCTFFSRKTSAGMIAGTYTAM
jgi:hypothetical protein